MRRHIQKCTNAVTWYAGFCATRLLACGGLLSDAEIQRGRSRAGNRERTATRLFQVIGALQDVPGIVGVVLGGSRARHPSAYL